MEGKSGFGKDGEQRGKSLNCSQVKGHDSHAGENHTTSHIGFVVYFNTNSHVQ